MQNKTLEVEKSVDSQVGYLFISVIIDINVTCQLLYDKENGTCISCILPLQGANCIF